LTGWLSSLMIMVCNFVLRDAHVRSCLKMFATTAPSVVVSEEDNV
jgi:hypothetical protein